MSYNLYLRPCAFGMIRLLGKPSTKQCGAIQACAVAFMSAFIVAFVTLLIAFSRTCDVISTNTVAVAFAVPFVPPRSYAKHVPFP